MIDPVTISGYKDVQQEPWFMRGERITIEAETLWIRVPGTYVCIMDTHRQGHVDLSVTIPVTSHEPRTTLLSRDMDIERSSLIEIIDRCIRYCQGIVPLRMHPSKFTMQLATKKSFLLNWRKELVFLGLRRRWAAKTIQKQIRESLSNPGYVLCRKRLLHEYKGLTSGH